MVMSEEFNDIKNDIQEYLEIKLDMIRLHMAENLSRILSSAASAAIIGYILFFILLFISIAAGYFFSSLLHSNELGFLLVAGFYILLLIVFLLFGKKIVERPIIKAVIKLFFQKYSDNEEK